MVSCIGSVSFVMSIYTMKKNDKIMCSSCLKNNINTVSFCSFENLMIAGNRITEVFPNFQKAGNSGLQKSSEQWDLSNNWKRQQHDLVILLSLNLFKKKENIPLPLPLPHESMWERWKGFWSSFVILKAFFCLTEKLQPNTVTGPKHRFTQHIRYVLAFASFLV